jgi:hypothetical protein
VTGSVRSLSIPQAAKMRSSPDNGILVNWDSPDDARKFAPYIKSSQLLQHTGWWNSSDSVFCPG